MKVKIFYSQGDESIEEVECPLQKLYDEGYRIAHVIETALGDTVSTINTTYVLEKP